MSTLYTQQSKNITKTWLLVFLFVLMFGFNAEISFAQNSKDENSIKEENIFLGFFKNMFSFSSKSLSATASKSLSDTKAEPVEQKTTEDELKIIEEVKVLENKLDTVTSSVNTQKSILDSVFLQKIVPEKIANTTKLDKKVKDRNNFLIKLAEKNPKEAISYIERHKLTDLQQGTIAPVRKISKTDITITINHFDYEEQDKADYFATYFDGRNTFIILSPDFKGLGGEYKISVLIGYTVQDRIIVTSISGLQPVVEQSNIQTRATEDEDYKVLVLLVDYLDSDSAQQLTDAETAHDVLFNGDLHDFFYEQSYGKMNMVGDVYGWHTLNSNSEGTICNPLRSDGTQAVSLGNQELLNYMISDDIQINNYDHVMVIANCKNVVGGGFAGFMNVASVLVNEELIGWPNSAFNIPTSVIKNSNGNANLHTMAHELGHVLYGAPGLGGIGGVPHANAKDCGSVIDASSGCTLVEYGNFYDAMGSWQAFSNHFRVAVKEYFGWFDPDQILTIAESSGEEDFYALTPTERIGGYNTGVGDYKIAKLQPAYAEYPLYLLEYRQGIGFDSNLLGSPLGNNTDGIFIYKTNLGSSGEVSASLLDMNPNNIAWEEDVKHVTLNVGRTYVDEELGVTINMINANPQHAFFQVTYAECEPRPLFYELYPGTNPASSPAEPGELAHYHIELWVEDRDNFCALSEIIFTHSIPSPITVSVSQIWPGWDNFKRFDISVPVGTLPGTYTLDIVVTDSGSGNNIVLAIPILVN